MESKISYDPLWKMVRENGMKKMDLAKSIGISNVTLAKLSKNESVTLTIIERICEYFNCNIGDVVEYVPAKENETMESDSIDVYEIFDRFYQNYKTYKKFNGFE